MEFTLKQILSFLVLFNPCACASLTPHHSNYMAAAQVDAAQVEEFTKPSEETIIGSPTIEESAKAPAPQNVESAYDEDDTEPEDVILPEELGKEEELDDEEDQKAVAPQIIEDEDDEDEDDEEQAEEPASKSTGRATDFSEEEDDD